MWFKEVPLQTILSLETFGCWCSSLELFGQGESQCRTTFSLYVQPCTFRVAISKLIGVYRLFSSEDVNWFVTIYLIHCSCSTEWKDDWLGPTPVLALSWRDWQKKVSYYVWLVFGIRIVVIYTPTLPPTQNYTHTHTHAYTHSDLSGVKDLQVVILNTFSSQSEEVRSAASYALG